MSKPRGVIVLHTSAPADTSAGHLLTVSVGFNPTSRQFIATRRANGRIRQVFVGPSLTLACSAANQALEDLAPLETLVSEPEAGAYRRTRPQYQQEVRFSEALSRLAALGFVETPTAGASPRSVPWVGLAT
jgi:hypothetical protein